MIKKIIALFLTFCICFFTLTACGKVQNSGETKEKQKYSATYLDYFDTVSVIVGFDESEDAFNKNLEFIKFICRYSPCFLYISYEPPIPKRHSQYYKIISA